VNNDRAVGKVQAKGIDVHGTTLAVKDGKIAIMKTPNGENPLVHGAKPILGCDVWEHSYYIDYRNQRPDYLKAFLDHLVNWDYVAERYEAVMK
jgi:Fe-Mn family superoxide dismutase